MKFYSSLAAGFISGVGLAVAGMTNPDNVIGFLDVFGAWKAQLMLVMVGAISVLALVTRLTRKLSKPIYAKKFYIPKQGVITVQLVTGAILFGAGWGIAGYCPGPAIASILSLDKSVFIFLVSMTGGMVLQGLASRYWKKHQSLSGVMAVQNQ